MKLVVNNKFNEELYNKRILSKPYIIAEIGVNHEGSMEKAYELIDLAKKGGADAVKFQTYKAETIASLESPYYWDINKEKTKSQFDLFKKYDTFNEQDYIDLCLYSKKINIEFISTPFDDRAVDFLDPLVNCFKIASADLTTIPLLKKIASKSKPVILSVGASTKNEIINSVNFLNQNKCEEIVLLHCVLNYPTENHNANLNKINEMKYLFNDQIIGYSDHTLPSEIMEILITSICFGAKIIEKHFTDDKNKKGNDHYHAMDVNDLIKFKKLIDQLFINSGNNSINNVNEAETLARKNARRSIVLKNAKLKDDILMEDDLIYKRPASGIPVSDWLSIIGRKLNKNLPKDHILKKTDIY